MRKLTVKSAIVTGVLLCVLTQITPVGARRPVALSAQQRTAVERWQVAVNQHRLPAVWALFAPSATLTVVTRTYRGTRAIEGWWHGQFTHNVHITFTSPVQALGSDIAVLIKRTTRGGDCPKRCSEQVRIRFSGSHFKALSLRSVRLPTPPSPVPMQTGVPPTPSRGPSPNVTPTIPT